MVLAAAGAESTNRARVAPRDRASIPMAPVPANRSRTSAAATRSPRLEKRPSRARSDMGRVPAGTGARRTPLAEPPMILIAWGRSAVEQPLDGLAGERPAKQIQEIRVGMEVRVGLDQREGPTAGSTNELDVL